MSIKPYLRSVGVNIRNERIQHKRTLPELAKLAGISKGNLSKIENKPCNISLETLLRLAAALGISLKDFLP
jgi:transcriptional regulator with XRE-family HTH domain